MPHTKEQYVRDAENDKAIWGAIGDLRSEQAEIKERVAVSEQQHVEFSEWRKKNEAQMDKLIAAVQSAAEVQAQRRGAEALGIGIIKLLAAFGLGGWLATHFGLKVPGVGSG